MKKLLLVIFIVFVAFFGSLLILIFVTGDNGYFNQYIKGIESRAFTRSNTYSDKLMLKFIYRSMAIYGQFVYPEAAVALNHVLKNNGDTLYLDNSYFINHPQILECIKKRKIGILYGATQKTKREHPEYYYPDSIDYRIFYAFNPLMVNKVGNRVTCYFENYKYAPLNTRIKTPFVLGKIKFTLFDGMIHVANNYNSKGFYCFTEFELE